MHGITLRELAEHVDGKVAGDPDLVVESVGTLENAEPNQITFLSNKKYLPLLKTTSAGAVITSEETDSPASLLIAEDPYYAFMQILVLIHGHRKHPSTGISERAFIAESANVGEGTQIAHGATVSENVKIGNNCTIYPNAFIGPDASVGDDCIIYPNVVIYDNTRVGDRVIIQANATIGVDGFGFATHNGEHHKIPQIGRVILEDDVEIGANGSIERGTLDDTVIGKGTKIGDMVAIGHGTRVGPHCLLVPQVGISGSTTLGHHCVLGGQVGVVGHIKIGNMVKIGAKAGVGNDIPDGATVLGTPAVEAGKAKRIMMSSLSLPEMRKRLKAVERKLKIK
ncbi:UDP-3-O-acylglucosamine N-acyltransferase [Anaerohalosphaera lusitana]|uniref:UDP-3-O-acylglucosamine N-acyltransferase n=1 Tax=Anaerohalosphaera lusitana TaxID=1936003 RepID=A0A1U9NMV4_9BACT|nr:UDP-3-O-(3-hydroxymyristoyl)glucosamine N-acyltransferase [Anaerohalosphaera lusitana]AQT69058.1 UDP-3-O-acylglucosamine N-acyltransferase [Anaerohalosphaera lusitana]